MRRSCGSGCHSDLGYAEVVTIPGDRTEQMDAGPAVEPTLHPTISAPSVHSWSQLCCFLSTPATPRTSTRCAWPTSALPCTDGPQKKVVSNGATSCRRARAPSQTGAFTCAEMQKISTSFTFCFFWERVIILLGVWDKDPRCLQKILVALAGLA